jgi:hypothetical protein
MSSSTHLSAVIKMLDECAPGYTIRLANHSRVIQFGAKVYRTFPKHDPMENGHVRKLVRFLGISTSCASKQLPGVIKNEQVQKEPAKPQRGSSSQLKTPKNTRPK